MTKHFKCKQTELIWHGTVSRYLPRDIQQVARRKLRMLNNAQAINDLRIPPNNRLEAMQGDRKGQYSIRVNKQWRICFKWIDGIVEAVEMVDYTARLSNCNFVARLPRYSCIHDTLRSSASRAKL